MPDLLVTSNGQPDRDGALIKITPESAGWEYVGFEVLRIEAGRSANRHSGSDEVCLVPLSGTCTVSAGDERVERHRWQGERVRWSSFCGLSAAWYGAHGRSLDGLGDRGRLGARRSGRRPDGGEARGHRGGGSWIGQHGAGDTSDPDGGPRGGTAPGGRGPYPERPLVELPAAQTRQG